jgi:hypothetical protein
LCDSFGVIFENHTLGDQRTRNGEGSRLQCEGQHWEKGLEAWLAFETKRREQNKKGAKNADQEAGPSAKKSKMATQADPGEEQFSDLKWRLKAGLNLLILLSQNIYKGVLGIDPETDLSEHTKWDIKDSSLLVSTPCPLEPYPTSLGGRWGIPRNSFRFPEGLRAKPPPEEAAPAAIKGRLLS